ncbi:hypothetical protein Fmac_028302 [Flemingia macrophylla]|uniref:Uncharacterized protein n=1 Tax=Flemingia macrophylla TaxID=520843 RepID=A0ABD1L744_9FABA
MGYMYKRLPIWLTYKVEMTLKRISMFPRYATTANPVKDLREWEYRISQSETLRHRLRELDIAAPKKRAIHLPRHTPAQIEIAKGAFGRLKAAAEKRYPKEHLKYGLSRWSGALTEAKKFDVRNYGLCARWEPPRWATTNVAGWRCTTFLRKYRRRSGNW